ncbi:MAG: hypothetical protein GY727_09890 [Gammaproteobacteria bacterium]|nr:hypothetical protein [Gammaproteobacteria bacterium]MCP4090767.1 hypothetical protein [Gammaproteobacteria bacterium]MCP4277194.1 hypothetical protein [Gammaproteobacteria bacterium]MCP4832816.1 hypothetical protein [Gammaproteobacteria bacterium]MCP4927996.1 hypothetical protein [Gammaproteobacteria bacterium]
MTDAPKINDHAQWIEENIRSYSEPAAITLSNFEVDWKSLTGSFRISLDDELLDKRFGFAPDAEGNCGFSIPLVHSPLTFPTVLATVNLTDSTKDAITHALQRSVPRVKSFRFLSSILIILKLHKGYCINMPVNRT